MSGQRVALKGSLHCPHPPLFPASCQNHLRNCHTKCHSYLILAVCSKETHQISCISKSSLFRSRSLSPRTLYYYPQWIGCEHEIGDGDHYSSTHWPVCRAACFAPAVTSRRGLLVLH